MWSNVCALASAACFNADGTFFEFFSNIIMLRMLFFFFFFKERRRKKMIIPGWNYYLRRIFASKQTEVVLENGWIKFCQSIYVCVSQNNSFQLFNAAQADNNVTCIPTDLLEESNNDCSIDVNEPDYKGRG